MISWLTRELHRIRAMWLEDDGGINSMSAYKRKWWQDIYFEFYLNTFLIKIQTRLLTESYERMTYDICRLRLVIWKWEVFEVQLYKRERP